MTWKREHLILLVIIAALAAYLAVRNTGRTHYVLPPVEHLAAKDITKVVIKNKDTEITLARKGGGWTIEPQGYAADKNTVDNLLRESGGLTLTALASEGGNDAIYGLDSDQRIEVDIYHGDKPVRQFGIGKAASSGEHTFVQLEGDKRIYHADHDLHQIFDKTVDDLRDKTVMKVAGPLTQITLAKGKRSLTIRRAAVPGLIGKKDAKETKASQQQETAHWRIGTKPANDSAVQSLIDTMSNLSCDAFIEGKAKKDYSAPMYTVTLAGSKTYVLSLYREKGDASYAGVSSESPYPFMLSAWRAKQIMKDFGSFIAAKK